MTEAKKFKIDSFVYDMEGPQALSGSINVQGEVSVNFRAPLTPDERQALHELLARVVARVSESIKTDLQEP